MGHATRPKPTLFVLLVLASGAAALLGFLREATIGALFGATRETDAYYAALTLPFLFAYFVVGGALAPPLTVSIATFLERGETARARALLGASIRAVLGIGLLAAAALALGRGFVAGLLVPGFAPAEVDLVAALLLRLMPYGVLTAVGLLAASALTAAGSYRTPAFAVFFGNTISVAILWSAGKSARIETAAIAMSVCGAVMLLALVPRLLHLDLLPDLFARGVSPPWRDSVVLLVSLGLAGAVDLSERPFASAAGVGALAILAFGSKLVHLPMRLFAAPLASVAFPRWVRGRQRRDTNSSSEAADTGHVVLQLLLFAAAVAAGAAGPITSLTFGRGRFDAEAVASLARTLAILSPSIVFVGLIELVSKYLVAGERTAAVARAHGLGFLAYLVAAASLARFGLSGLAAARDLSWGVAAAGLVIPLLRHESRLDLFRRPIRALVATLVATFLAAAAVRVVPGGPLVHAALATAAVAVVFLLSSGLPAVSAEPEEVP